MTDFIIAAERLADDAQQQADSANNAVSSVLWAQIAATLRQAAQQAIVALDCTEQATHLINVADAATLAAAIHGA